MPIEITNVGIKGPKGDTGASGLPLLTMVGEPITAINPISTFTVATVTNDGSGKTRLTGGGSHGLSIADAVGANIYVLSGTGWTAGLKKVLALDADNGTSITIDVPFASQGLPTLITGSTSGISLLSSALTIPVMTVNGVIKADATFSVKNSANTKKIQFRHNNTVFAESAPLINMATYRITAVLQNRNSLSSQVGMSLGMNGIGSSANALSLLANNTAVSTSFNIFCVPFQAEPLTLERYVVEMYS